jgi:hypothetical protein
MSTISKPFKTILDRDYENEPRHWVYVHEDDTLEEACSHRQFDEVKGRLPRDRYEAIHRKDVKLEYAPSNPPQPFPGAIYELRARD